MYFNQQLLRILNIFCFIPLFFNGYAQFEDIKLGKITHEYKNYSNCDFAPNSPAIILRNDGYSSIKYVNRFAESYYTTHKVIKILNKDGLSAANIIFTTAGKLKDIQAATYNKVDNKWVATTFNPDDIFKENLLKKENFIRYKIPMPNVSVGSIIEVIIKISYPKIPAILDWNFQDLEYPVLSSRYQISNSRYFFFDTEVKSTFPIYHEYIRNELLTNYSAQNIPPVDTEESYSPISFFRSSNLKFQLKGFHFTNRLPETIQHRISYQKFGEYLLKSKIFEKFLKNRKIDILRTLNISLTSKNEQSNIIHIFNSIKNKIKWDGYSSFLPEKSIAQTIKDGKAKSSDINMLLVAALRDAKIDAYPIICSTRENGKLHPKIPFEEYFNYLICAAKIGDEFILLDASRKEVPFGMLPYELMNGGGFIVDDKENGFISFQENALHQETYVVNLKIEEEKIEGTLTSKLNDYAAFPYYRIKENQEDPKEMEVHFDNNIADEWELDDPHIKEFSLGDPIIVKGKVSKEIDPDELIYIEPVLFPIFNENPFKKTKRSTPVDIPYQIKYKLLYNLDIPEGYVVEESPSSSKISLPNNEGKFLYAVEEKNNKISINITFDLRKMYFSVDEYPVLYEFFNKVHEQIENLIVLKKVD